jgi:serine/threonine-protein kinase
MSQLQTALGDTYHVEREIGGGGMSRLFLATEASLNRRVVVKLLPPDFASEVSAARFKREIEVAAHLQHPHVLPILAAGSKDGLLFYVMPYVEGESLRHRLTRERPLPVSDAVRILTEVADALDFSHAAGVVHRDIKPENILLEGKHAVLADFGVAHALDSARSGGALTGTGMGIGTPGYMSPEQASGDKGVDPRSDVYALAVVGYEMLVGVPPFSGPTAQAVLAAHLRDAPPAVTSQRKEVPAHVSAAIAKALAKDPAQRFATAGAFRDALAADAVRPMSSSRKRLMGGVAAALAAAVAALVVTARSTKTLDPDVIAVAPFQVLDPALALWHEGLVDVLSRNFDGAGALRAVPPTIVIRRWSGRDDAASASELGRATGARLVVTGSLVASGSDSVRIRASIVDAKSGRPIAEIERKDLASQMDRLTDSLSVGLLRELGPSRGGAKLSSIGSSSLPAIKAFLQGEQFYRHAQWDSATVAYQRAIALDSTFALALVRLSIVGGWTKGVSDVASNDLEIRAGRYNHGLAPRESLLVAASALFGAIGNNPPDYFTRSRELVKLANDAVRRYPDDPETWHGLAEVRQHVAIGGDIEMPLITVLDAEQRAIALDSAYAPAYIHAIEVAFATGQPALARKLLADFAVVAPSGQQADAMRVVALAADPATAWKPAMRSVVDTLSALTAVLASQSSVDMLDANETSLRFARHTLPSVGGLPTPERNAALFALASVFAERGHVRESDSLVRLAIGRLFSDAELSTLHFVEWCVAGAVPAAECDAGAGAALRRSVIRTYIPWWGIRRDTTSLRTAIRTLDSAAKADTTAFRGARSRFLSSAASAMLSLARKDSAAALKALDALPDTACRECLVLRLTHAQLMAAQGRPRDALTLVNRRTFTSSSASSGLLQFERGKLAEQLGDKQQAIIAYGLVVDMWVNADSSLQPIVNEAHAGLKRLGAESASRTKIPTGQ